MKHRESELQRDCIKWIRYKYPHVVCFCIPNGGKRNAVEAAIMKAEGVTPGVADLFVMLASFGWHGLFIELKTGSNKQTESQIRFGAAAARAGYRYVVCRTLDEFIETAGWYINSSNF